MYDNSIPHNDECLRKQQSHRIFNFIINNFFAHVQKYADKYLYHLKYDFAERSKILAEYRSEK